MPRGKTTTTGTNTTTETQRITSLEPRQGAQLSSLEEAVVRMHHGVSLRPNAALATNAVTDELVAKLLDIEVRAFEESGRIDSLGDIPVGTAPSARTAHIVSELKKKS